MIPDACDTSWHCHNHATDSSYGNERSINSKGLLEVSCAVVCLRPAHVTVEPKEAPGISCFLPYSFLRSLSVLIT